MEAEIVIVGAGTAGAALGELLSENGISVVIVEAGDKQDRNSLISNPLNSGRLVLTDTNAFFWGLGHARLDNAPDNKRFPIVAGELWGGSSSVNGLQFVEGTAKFFRRWEELVGDPSWGPKNAFRTYRELQKFNGVPGQFDPTAHGFKGPFDVRQAVRNLEAATQFVAALKAEGYPESPDYNDPDTPIGAFTYWQLSEKPNKSRESSSTAYLSNLVPEGDVHTNHCHSLAVISKAQVLKISLKKNDKDRYRAGSVRAIVNNCQTKIKATRAIICSAGIQSSLLLELSGIGDAKILQKFGIKSKINNPNVGRNIVNHPIISLSGVGSVPVAANPDLEALYSGGAEIPDPTDTNPNGRSFQLIGIDSPGNPGVFTIAALLLDAKSTGQLHVENSSALRMPFFDFNYFTDPRDIISAVALYGILYRVLVNMGLTPILLTGAPAPPPANSLNPTDPTFQTIQAYVIANYSQAYHWTGSCRMAPSIETGVVDNNCRVFGTENLYVADLTVLPFNAAGNGMAPALLVGNILAQKLSKRNC